MEAKAGRGAAAGWIVATLIVLACTAFVRHQNVPDASLGGLVGTPRPAGPALVAVTVFQMADCDEATGWLAGLRAAGVAEIRGLLVGPDADLARAATRLGAVAPGVEIVRASRRTLLGLRVLGYGATPYILVVDRRGRVRWTSPPPRGAAARLRMTEVLERLLADETAEDA